jgi:hypothetical protein
MTETSPDIADPVGSAVRGLSGLSLDPAELGPAARGVISEFAALGFGEMLRDPGRARDECRNMSQTFQSMCTHRGIPAEVVTGAFSHEVPGLPGVEAVLAMHTAAALTATATGEVAVDWTARQYDGSVPVPLVVPLPAWRQVWAELHASVGD